MKILFVAFEVPYPLDRGGRIKTFHTLKKLTQKHEVYLICLVRNKKEFSNLRELSTICSKTEGFYLPITTPRKIFCFTKSIIRKIPFIILLYYKASIKKRINSLLKEQTFDLIYVEHLHMAQYVSDCNSIKKILDQQNVEHLIVKRYSQTLSNPILKYFANIESNKLKKYEIEICKKFHKIFVVSEEDKRVFLNYLPELKNIYVLPIGVDILYFTWAKPKIESRQLIFIGTLQWIPNLDGVLWFYNNVYPKIISKNADIKLIIVGDSSRQKKLKSLKKDKNVKIVGYLNDIRNIVQDSSIFIVPLRIGSGMRVKILNALAQGIPVVSTSIGCEGIELSKGENILIADNDLEFAEAIMKIFREPFLAENLSKNGRELIEKKYNWDVIYNRFDKILESDKNVKI